MLNFAIQADYLLINNIFRVTEMTEIVTNFLQQHLYLHAFVIFICFLSIIVAMVIDLVAGIQKAVELNEARTSTGYKKTCDKARKYFGPFGITVCIDIVTCIIVPIPVFSILWSIWVGFCEFKSVREKAWEKAEIRKQDRTMQVILENKDDIAKTIVELLKQATEKDEEEKTC